MEAQEEFIAGIYNFCDRWCEACGLTSRCRVFADVARAEAAGDPGLRSLVEAPPLARDMPPEPPRWMQELLAEANEPVPEDAVEPLPPMPPAYEAVQRRARAYATRVHRWLRARDFVSITAPSDPRAVVGWYHTLIPTKVYRALMPSLQTGPDEGDQMDRNGSAHVALLGIDRSHTAWLQLVESGRATSAEVQPLIAELVWLGDRLEELFPGARGFVRLGFDTGASA